MMALSIERALPVLVHGSEAVGHAYAGKGTTTPDQLLAFSQRFPDATCVFAHWGGGLPFYGLMPEVRRAFANVYFDSAASPLLYDRRVFDVVVRSVGVEHVLFGSDYPLLPVNQVAEQVRATLDVDAASSVLRGNAARLLGLIDG
jgi:predicted TIM-barrel fold metal-dependent hydrolase